MSGHLAEGQGRESNESLYPVELTESFLIGETEITNAQYRQFRPQHNSGPGLDGKGNLLYR